MMMIIIDYKKMFVCFFISFSNNNDGDAVCGGKKQQSNIRIENVSPKPIYLKMLNSKLMILVNQLIHHFIITRKKY